MAIFVKEEITRQRVIDYLERLDLHNKYLGEQLLVSAVYRVYQDPEKYRNKITGLLYQELAIEFGINKCSVEKDMRKALERAWTNNYSELHYGLYVGTFSQKTEKPTTAKFIWLTVEILKLQLD